MQLADERQTLNEHALAADELMKQKLAEMLAVTKAYAHAADRKAKVRNMLFMSKRIDTE